MQDEPHVDPIPFGLSGILLALACIAMARLPDSFVATFYRSRPFSSAQSGWAYRLLVLAAVGQAAYIGFVVLRPERITTNATDKGLPRARLATSASRMAAAGVALTFVYGVASFAITGQRGGFWLFVLLALAQLAWYYRQVSEIVEWLSFQPPASGAAEGGGGGWAIASGDFVPPLARGLPGPNEKPTFDTPTDTHEGVTKVGF